MNNVRKIIRDSELLLSIVDEINIDELDEEYIEELFNILPIKICLVKKMYEGYFDFNEIEILELINGLNYLINTNLEDILLFSKYMRSNYIKERLNPDLRRLYDKL